MTTRSVVVPTRDRPDALRQCVAALTHQVGAGQLEIIVVDDGSRDAASVATVASGHVLVRLEGVGPAAARNAGAHAATGEIVLFTDDDCQPEPGWAAALVAAIGAGADAAGGRTVPSAPTDPYAVAAETITAFVSARTGMLATNNFACRRDVLLELPFDETFPLAAGEDRDWSARASAAGWTLVRERSAVVRHAPALGLRGFWRQNERYGRGAQRIARQTRLSGARSYAALVREGFRGGVRVGCLVCLAQVATGIGFLRESRS